MNISELYSIFKQHPIISIDSRSVQSGSLFFALKGANFNGNEFAKITLENGCSYAIVDEEKFVEDDRYILVEDVLSTLQALAAYHREQLNIPVIGITGTNGKTTTKELLSAVLATKYSMVCTKGNLNNHIGVPITVLSIKDDTEIAIIEMGANHQNEIGFLCEIAKPTHGLITNIGRAHLEGFGSFEGVIKTKNELYNYLFKQNGIVFVNSGNSLLMDLVNSRSVITYGIEDSDYCKGKIFEGKTYLEAEIEVLDLNQGINQQRKQSLFITSNLVGAYNFENLLAAVAFGSYFNVDPLSIEQAIKQYFPDNNRSQLLNTEKNTIIMDAYNANPSSMELALANFFISEDPNQVVILGEMLELGEYSVEEHLKIAEYLKAKVHCTVFLIGKSFTSLNLLTFKCFENIDAFCFWIQENPVTGKKILIKGSRGNRLEKALQYL